MHPFVDCQTCARLPSSWTAERLPPAAQRLGLAESPDSPTTARCPDCGMAYRFEQDGPELSLVRLKPGQMRAEGLVWFWGYRKLIRQLPPLLDSEDPDRALYAARSLARHHLDTGDAEEMALLLAHASWAVRRAALLEISPDEMTPLVTLVIERLFDQPRVADAARTRFRVHEDASPVVQKYGKQLVGACASHSLTPQAVALLQHITRHYAAELDVTPCVPRLLELLCDAEEPEPLELQARQVLLRYIRSSPEAAESFLMARGEVPRSAPLRELEQAARERLAR